MKTLKITIILLISFNIFSCQEFLEEKYMNPSTDRYFTTTQGIENLVGACYVTNKVFFGQEEGYDFSEIGTDIFDYAQQHPQQYQFTYTVDFNPTNSRLVILWAELYRGVNACNDAIEILSDPEKSPLDKDKTRIRLAEVRYLRALYNWIIVETWGGVVLNTKPIKGVVKTAKRSPISDFYKIILEDLTFAVENLKENDNINDKDYGRVTKWAALALRSRMNLTWGYYSGEEKYFEQAFEDAKAVIESGRFSLYDNYFDIWDLKNNGMKNKENIWAINYSYNQYADFNSLVGGNNLLMNEYRSFQRPGDKPWDTREGGHHGHLMFGTQYDVVPGMIRDMENGRPFRRYMPTKYLIDVFNKNLDERFEGSFKTVWYVNNLKNVRKYPVTKIEIAKNILDTDTIKYIARSKTLLNNKIRNLDSVIIYVYKDGNPNDTIYNPASKYINKNGTGKEIFVNMKDTCIFMTTDTIPRYDQLTEIAANYYFHATKGYWCLGYNNLFNPDGTINDAQCVSRNLYYELKKFYDNQRLAADGTGSQRSGRDAMVIRLSEMYLNAAEALWKLGRGDEAYSYFLIPLANKRSKNGNGIELLSSYGINSGSDLNIDFFLDERAREFAGEQLRWFDLKRTGKLIERIRKYAGNALARQNFDEHFTLRPIPQVQIDAVYNKDEFTQNPGY